MKRAHRVPLVHALIFASLAAVAACDALPFVGEGPTLLRVENASGSTLTEVRVYLPDDRTIDAPSLAPGARTGFVQVGLAYRIATVEGRQDGQPFRLQVVDYVGEEPLGAGRFTYVLDVFDPGSTEPSVTLTLRED